MSSIIGISAAKPGSPTPGGDTQDGNVHIFDAVLSPAPSGGTSDLVAEWPKDDRIVCYRGCPRYLSSIRASNLMANVYVIDEGFWEWHERDYPMADTEIISRPAKRVIRGRTAATFASETAWPAMNRPVNVRR